MSAARTLQIATVLTFALFASTSVLAADGLGSQGSGDWPDHDDYVYEVRPYGKYANDYARATLALCGDAYANFGGGDSASYTYGFAFYAADFGEQAGHVICWNRDADWSEIDAAYQTYLYLRYQQGLYDYYAAYYARFAFQESGYFAWYRVATLGLGAAYYARADFSY